MEHKKLKGPNPWWFFALSLGISWYFWLWIIYFDLNVWQFPGAVLGGIGLFGPAAAEIILLIRFHTRELRIDWLHRVFDFRRISKEWHAVIWLTFPILNSFAILLSFLTGGSVPEFGIIADLLSGPWRIIPYAIFILFMGPLPEELGWRGYALDGLQERWNALVSSIILGFVWMLWHLPLFFMKGTFQHDQLGFLTPNFWMFCLGTIFTSILFTWVYNNTNRSTLAAILFHFMINFSGEIFQMNELARTFQLVLTIALSLIVVIIWGPSRLVREKK